MKKECKHIEGDERRRFKFCPLCGKQLLENTKYEKDDIVYLFDTHYPPSIEKCEVIEVLYDDLTPTYALMTTAGRRLGYHKEAEMFKSKEDCCQYYINFLKARM